MRVAGPEGLLGSPNDSKPNKFFKKRNEIVSLPK